MKTKKRTALKSMLKELEFVYIRLNDLQNMMHHDTCVKISEDSKLYNDIFNSLRLDIKSILDSIIDDL